MSVPSSNRVNSSASVKSFDSSWKKYAATIILDEDAKTTSSMCANFSYALDEDLDNSAKCELLAGFTPEKLMQPFDPEHVCNVFLKCRILLTDYIKTLDDDWTGFKTKTLPKTRNKQMDESNTKQRQLGISRGRGLLSGSVADLKEKNFIPTLNSTPLVNLEAVEDSVLIDINNNKNEALKEENCLKKQDIQVPQTKIEKQETFDYRTSSEQINFEPISLVETKNEPLQDLKKTQDLSLFESKYNFKYKDNYYRLIIQNDKTVADLKQKISYKINLDVFRIGLSFNDVQPDKEIFDQMDIVTFNRNYKFSFYVFDLNDFNSEKTNEKNHLKKTEEPKRLTITKVPSSNEMNTVMDENHKMKSELEMLKEENERLKNQINMINSESYSVDHKSMASFNSSYASFRSMNRSTHSRSRHHY